MPNIEVKCSVSNCFFYKQGNNCGAPAIMIEIDQHSFPKEEFADELGIQNQLSIHLEHQKIPVAAPFGQQKAKFKTPKWGLFVK
jgi:hypothetical protein